MSAISNILATILEKISRRWLYALAVVVVVALLVAWYWHGYAGRRETDIVISRLRESAATSERRADAIIDATRQREVTVRETVRKKVADLPADRLATALDRLLAEYRADDQ